MFGLGGRGVVEKVEDEKCLFFLVKEESEKMETIFVLFSLIHFNALISSEIQFFQTFLDPQVQLIDSKLI